MKRYVLVAGYASSEVGALMATLSFIAVATGAKPALIMIDVVLLAGLGFWLWWRKSLVAAALTLALVAYEYLFLALSRPGSTWLRTYPILFLVALLAHGRRRRYPPRGAVSMETSDPPQAKRF